MSALVNTNQPMMMGSKEIASVTGKAHGHVLRDIKTMIKEIYGQNPDLDRIDFQGIFVEKREDNQQVKEIFLDRMHAETLVTGYDVKRRMAVIQRWMVLEEETHKPQLPDFTNPVEAARAWADAKEAEMVAVALVEEKQKQITLNAPKVGFYDTVTQAPDTYDMSQVAKLVNIKGMGRNKLIDWLRKQKVFRPNTTEPYQHYVNQGYFKIATTHKSGNVYPKTVAYQRGVDFIIRLLRDHGFSV